jgi:hypothetical protein
VDDGLDVDEEPGTLSTLHEYNLRNQGWVTQATNNITEFVSDTGVYPANNQIWSTEKDSDGNVSGNKIRKFGFGSTPAPKGSYILDPFDKDREAASGLIGIADETIDDRPEAVAFFAGRACYALGGDIFISQVLNENRDNAGICHQVNDPTAEDISDLLATDGLVVNIPEASGITKLINKGSSLIVFARNGVWKIAGVDGVFKATEFSVSKVSDEGILSGKAAASVKGTPYWLSDSGIFRLGTDQTGLNEVVEPLTEKTIKDHYVAIPNEALENASTVFDKINDKIYWFYKDSTLAPANSSPYYYNKVLVFDLRIQAFYKHSISQYTDSPFIIGAFVPSNISDTEEAFNVVVGNDNVVAGAGNQVVVTQEVRTFGDPTFKLICIEPNKSTTANNWTFAEFNDTGFTDWLTADTVDTTGANYVSYIESGYELADSTAHFKQAPYLVCHCTRTETGFVDDGSGQYIFVRPSSLLVQPRWDWSDNGASGKIGSQQQVYRFRRNWLVDPSALDFDNGFPLTVTRSKLRGRGKSLQLRFESEQGKDFNLAGYHITLIGGDRL